MIKSPKKLEQKKSSQHKRLHTSNLEPIRTGKSFLLKSGMRVVSTLHSEATKVLES